MDISKFLDPKNEYYQIKVITPTHTYGTMYDLNSKFHFEIGYDEYDTETDWEFIIEVNGENIATFDNIEDVKRYIYSTKKY